MWDGAPPAFFPLLFAHALVVGIYVAAYMSGNQAQREATENNSTLAGAVRQIAAQSMLLSEAEHELELARTGRGRFTGTQMGSFMLGELLGKGGMGEVYAAVSCESGEEAAAKFCDLEKVISRRLLSNDSTGG